MKSKNFEYKYIVNGNTVIALARDHGKMVRGIAKCSPDDEFNLEYGKQLAAARCNFNIAKRRLHRAVKDCDLYEKYFDEVKKRFENAQDFLWNSDRKYAEAENELNKLLLKGMG